MILSTGMSTETEIIRTNELLEELNVNRSFLHCNSTYPTPIGDVTYHILIDFSYYKIDNRLFIS